MPRGILCAGNIIIDLIKVINSWPNEGMLTSITKEQQHGGGSVFNCLIDLAILDPTMPLSAIAMVGNDQHGVYLKNQLSDHGVDCSHVFTSRSSPTSYTDVMTVKNGQRTFFHSEGANTELDIHHFEQIALEPKIFHLGYISLLKNLDQKDEIFGTHAARLLHSIQDRGCKTSIDLVSMNSHNFKQIALSSLPYTNYLTINEIEAELTTGLVIRNKDSSLNPENIVYAAKQLLQSGVKDIVTIHFPEGSYATTSAGEELYVPSYKIEKHEIKGSVGAGDAFCSGLLLCLHENKPLGYALKFAAALARFNLLHQTSTGGAVSWQEIEEYMKVAEQNQPLFTA